MGLHGLEVLHHLFVGVQAVDEAELDGAIELFGHNAGDALGRNRLHGGQVETFLAGERVGHLQPGQGIGVETGIDGDDARLWIQQTHGKRAPTEGIADQESGLGPPAVKQAFQEVDFLHGNAEAVGEAFPVLQKPSERGFDAAVQVAWAEAGRD